MFKKIIRALIYIILGGVVGYFYYYFFGCKENCPITSNPKLTVYYAMVIGFLLSIIFEKNEKSAS